MTTRKRIIKKGGSDYANVTDKFTILDNAIKHVKGGCSSYSDVNSSYMLSETKGGGKNNKKGGCSSYSDVNASYMLSETKGGGRNNKKGGCSSYADVNASYMLSETKGGRRYKKGGSDLLTQTQGIINNFNDILYNQPPAQQAPPPQPLAPPAPAPAKPVPAPAKPPQQQASAKPAPAPPAPAPQASKGGCPCNSGKSGGAIELAPFAAAVALMAARYMSDSNILDDIIEEPKSKSMSKSKPKSTPKTKSTPKPKSKTTSKKSKY